MNFGTDQSSLIHRVATVETWVKRISAMGMEVVNLYE